MFEMWFYPVITWLPAYKSVPELRCWLLAVTVCHEHRHIERWDISFVDCCSDLLIYFLESVIFGYNCWWWRSDLDILSEAGRKKAEMLFKELMMMITAIQDSFRAQSSYELEQTLDFSTACHQFKVSMWYHSNPLSHVQFSILVHLCLLL